MAAINTRTKDVNNNTAPDPNQSPDTRTLRPTAVQTQLWFLCSATAHDAFESPWDSIALDLWDRLTAIFVRSHHYRAAETVYVYEMGYDQCVRSLVRDSPPVYNILMEVRGLAQAAWTGSGPMPTPTIEKRGPTAPTLPGDQLMYEDLDFEI